MQRMMQRSGSKALLKTSIDNLALEVLKNNFLKQYKIAQEKGNSTSEMQLTKSTAYGNNETANSNYVKKSGKTQNLHQAKSMKRLYRDDDEKLVPK